MTQYITYTYAMLNNMYSYLNGFRKYKYIVLELCTYKRTKMAMRERKKGLLESLTAAAAASGSRKRK